MKKAVRLSIILGTFAGLLTFSSPNYAGTLAFSPGLGIGPQVLQTIKTRLELQPPAILKKKKAVPDPYANALKIARALATSA